MREYKSTIEKFMPFMKPGWVACDQHGTWCWFSTKPTRELRYWDTRGEYCEISHVFSIAPSKDWKNSLIRVGE